MGNHIDMINGPLGDKIVKYAIPLAVTGVLQQLFNAADLLGNFLNSRMELTLARKLLGGLFLVCGARELCYRDKKAR